MEIKYLNLLHGGVAKSYTALNSCSVLRNVQMSTAFGLCLQHSAQVPRLTNLVVSDCDVGLHSPLYLSGVKARESISPAFHILVLCQFSHTQVPLLQHLIQGPSFIWQI